MAGRTTLVGVGSLVSETSARESFAFTNFRIGQIRGWRRAFNQANWVNVANGWGTADSHDVAALAMVPAEPDVVSRVALLDVDADGLKGFYERETGYRIVSTSFRRLNAAGDVEEAGEALMCAACENDAEADRLWAPGGAMESHCRGSQYVAEWMQASLRPLWPPPTATLLPSIGYLRLCADAHATAGLLNHFLDSTVLNDRTTMLREHCERTPELADLLEGPCSEEGDAR